ncbi:ACP S-malonyltransferase [Kitasatospora sp. NPDC101801]|uniref:ACP S-malonyltransferase n=1 Tax=Kitasatospora sp. NPDC101801 TaxID=3364103 RepID=UPI0038225EAE
MRTLHLFPGQGDFELRVLRDWLATRSTARDLAAEVFAAVDRAAAEAGLPAIGPIALGTEPPDGRESVDGPPGAHQLALFGACLTVHRAAAASGRAPDRLLGVSFGEVGALTAAGVFELTDGARIAAEVGRLLPRDGGLTWIGAGEAAVREFLDEPDVAIACVNSRTECILAGPVPALERVAKLATAHGLPAVRVQVPFYAHHPALIPAAATLAAFVRDLPCHPPNLPVYSAAHLRTYQHPSAVPELLGECLTRPVRLPKALRLASGNRPAVLLEAGTGSALGRSARQVLPTATVLSLPDLGSTP